MLKKTTILKNTLLIFICFYIINLILSYTLFVLIKNQILNNITYLDELLEIILLLIVFAFLCYFIKKDKTIRDVKIKKINIKLYSFLPLVFISAIFFRISVDPIIWVDETFKFIEISVNSDFTSNNNFTKNILLFFSTVILTPIVEEIMFRGIIIKVLCDFKLSYKILISSVLFSLMHLPIDINYFIIIFFLGITLGIIAIKLNLTFAIIFHSTYNLIFHLLSMYPNDYWQLINILEFNYIYWFIVLIAFFCLILILKKIWINKKNINPYYIP
ncbi:lysostaphin resistance A-like protein [Flavobacterium sp. HNIBRBA15423]|uniref:lysostaphin resistance A-like protein n=1 Tax=Flavobacterium sp. HNIBRBA15423 TaxID=3458683 RepID=UPI004044390B